VHGDVVVVLRFHEAPQRHVLVGAVLQQQPALAHDVVVGAVQDGAEAVHAGLTRVQGQPRLEAHVAPREVRVVFSDVRGVAHHDIEFLAAHGIEPVALAKLDVADPLQLGVAACHLEGGDRDVDADHLRARPLARDGQGHGARAGAEVEHAGVLVLRQAQQRPLHQQLGVRPRDQHGRGHAQRHGPELAKPGHVGDRLAGKSPPQQLLVAGRLLLAQLLLRPGVEVAARLAQHHAHQELGVEARAVADAQQDRRAVLEVLPYGQVVVGFSHAWSVASTGACRIRAACRARDTCAGRRRLEES
jgi:hypothetical protein